MKVEIVGGPLDGAVLPCSNATLGYLWLDVARRKCFREERPGRVLYRGGDHIGVGRDRRRRFHFVGFRVRACSNCGGYTPSERRRCVLCGVTSAHRG